MEIDYRPDRNEVHINGCFSCPLSCFIEDFSGIEEKVCPLLGYKNIKEPGFPADCPLCDPNFKLVRHLEAEK